MTPICRIFKIILVQSQNLSILEKNATIMAGDQFIQQAKTMQTLYVLPLLGPNLKDFMQTSKVLRQRTREMVPNLN
jgi:hypothetical protein